MELSSIYYLIESPKVKLPAPAMRVLPGYVLSCSATGTHPIFTSLIRNSTVLVNTTDTAKITVKEQGNYTCLATNKYGAHASEISVAFTGKEPVIGMAMFPYAINYLNYFPFGIRPYWAFYKSMSAEIGQTSTD